MTDFEQIQGAGQGSLLGPCLTFLVLSGIGVVAVVLLRDKLLRLVSTRRRRVIEGLVLVGLQAIVTVLFGATDARAIWKGNPPLEQADVPLLYWLAATASGMVMIQAFVVLHADASEEQRARSDHQHRTELGERITERDDARAQRDFVTRMSGFFLRVVSGKRKRLSQISTREQLLDSLEPMTQIKALVFAAHQAFNELINGNAVAGAFRVRVAYFRPDRVGAALKLLACWDGLSEDCVSPIEKLVPFLALKGPQRSLVVAAAVEGTNMLVPDARAADANGQHPFKFFGLNPVEGDIMKSVAALPIRLDGDTGPYSVLVVDTDCLGFFDHADLRLEQRIKIIVNNLAHRLHLETRLLELLS